MKCPLLEREVTTQTCTGCMYQGLTKACLFETRDTTAFARERGIAPSDVEMTRVKAEKRIRAGLLCYEYLQWIQSYKLVKSVGPAFQAFLNTSPIADLGVTAVDLGNMVQSPLWGAFCRAKGEINIPHAEALFMNSWQLEDLQAPANFNMVVNGPESRLVDSEVQPSK